MNSILNINDEYKKDIVDSVHDAFTESGMREGFYTGNHIPMKRWDNCFKYIIEKFMRNNVEVIRSRRGIWEFVLIYFEDTRTATLIVKDERLSQISEEKITQYINVLLRKNEKYDSLSNGSQITFTAFDDMPLDVSKETLDQIQADVLKEYDSRVDQITFIKIDVKDQILRNIDHVLTDSKLNEVKSISLNEFMPGVYQENGTADIDVNHDAKKYETKATVSIKKVKKTMTK